MGSQEDIEKEGIVKFIKEADDKLEKFTQILEKFGLDIITKMGQTNMNIKILTDKINEIHKATIDIKALAPQLNNVIESQKILEAEIDLIRSLIQKADIYYYEKEHGDTVERDASATDKKQAIIEQFVSIKKDIDVVNDPVPIIKKLEDIKEDIFVFTGGHRILYEIGQFISKLGSKSPIPDEMKENLREKITFWINKLSIKG